RQPDHRGLAGAAAGNRCTHGACGRGNLESGGGDGDWVRLHAADRPHRPLGGADRKLARLCCRGTSARRRRARHHVRRDFAERAAADRGGGHGAFRLRDFFRRFLELPRLRHSTALRGLGHCHRGELQPDRQLLVDRHFRRHRDRVTGGGSLSRGRWHPERIARMKPSAGALSPDALTIENLDVAYRVRGRDRPVLRGLNLRIRRGEAYGLVGESGSGKSTAAFAAVRYLPRNGCVTGGRILVDGLDLMALSPAKLRRLRTQSVSMVYQDPGRALNPALRIGRQMTEVFEAGGLDADAAQARAQEMLSRVQISSPNRVMANYPHELSGGMQQRVIIAMALSTDPALLILDEPTTGLDATVEAEVLDLIARLRTELSTSILFISHSLPVIARMCDRVGVLYAGELIEEGPASAVLADPRHPYTVGLLRCAPQFGRRKNDGRLTTIPGFPPAPGSLVDCCVFADRCVLAAGLCRERTPPPMDLGGRSSRCHFPELVADMPVTLVTPETPDRSGTPVASRLTSRDRPVLRTRNLSKTFQVGGKNLY